MRAGQSVHLLLAEGKPAGLMTTEVINWTSRIVAAPSSDLAALLTRPEATRTSIHVVLGDARGGLGGQFAYINEGGDVSEWLYQHAG